MPQPDPRSRRRYDPLVGADRDYLQTALNEAMRAKADELRKRFPGKYDKFRVIPGVNVHIKSPGSPGVMKSILREIFSERGAKSTQKAIRDRVQRLHPNSAIYKDWTVILPTYTRKIASEVAVGYGVPFAYFVMPKLPTLSKLHQLAQLLLAKHSGETRSYKATIEISNDSIFINGKAHKISESRSKVAKKVYQYKIVRLQIADLEKDLQAPAAKNSVTKVELQAS